VANYGAALGVPGRCAAERLVGVNMLTLTSSAEAGIRENTYLICVFVRRPGYAVRMRRAAVGDEGAGLGHGSGGYEVRSGRSE
jgi:hypothetical protein